jgi:hypothetical protein
MGEMMSYRGTHLITTTTAGITWTRVQWTESKLPLDVVLSACGHRLKGTIVRPLDDSALSLAGNMLTDEGNRRGATTLRKVQCSHL